MQNRPWPLVVAVCATLLVIAGCRTKEQSAPTPAPLVSLSVAPDDSSIAPGTTVQMTATGTFADNSKRNVTASVTWDSSIAGIATISNAPGSQGLATATLSTGSTVISAVAEGITGTTALTTSHVNTITVTPATPPCIAPGTTQQFAAMGTLVSMNSATQDLTSFATWTSSSPAIVTVSDTAGSKGLTTATPNNSGSAAITATFDGVTSGSATLTSSHVSSLAVAPGNASIAKGTTQQFTATGTLGCGNTQDLTTSAIWSSSVMTTATISDTGLATAVDVGSTAITAMFDSVTSSSATLTVTPAVLTSIATTPTSTTIPIGTTVHFIATGTFTDSTTQDLTSLVTWNSSDIGIATISNASGSRGVATSQAEGTTTITASFSGITSNNATLTITPAELVSITITPASASVPVGTTFLFQFSATGTFTDGSSKDLTTLVKWVSSNIFVASISNTPGFQGQATPINVGTTTIIATSGNISGTAVFKVASF
jgi:hypothetical protein